MVHFIQMSLLLTSLKFDVICSMFFSGFDIVSTKVVQKSGFELGLRSESVTVGAALPIVPMHY